MIWFLIGGGWFLFGFGGALIFWRDCCKAYGYETFWQSDFLFQIPFGIMGFLSSLIDVSNTRGRGKFLEAMKK